jgi:hypothetical protein
VPDLILPGHTPDPEHARDGDEVTFESTEPVLVDGRLYALRIHGTAEVQRGPLGQALDLREDLRASGRWPASGELDDLLDELADRSDEPDPLGRLLALCARLTGEGGWSPPPELDELMERLGGR